MTATQDNNFSEILSDQGALESRRVAPPGRGGLAVWRSAHCEIGVALAETRLKRMLIKRCGRDLHAGRADSWIRDWFETPGLYRLRGTVRYSGAA